jgi:hypothetical protein
MSQKKSLTNQLDKQISSWNNENPIGLIICNKNTFQTLKVSNGLPGYEYKGIPIAIDNEKVKDASFILVAKVD